LESFDFRWHCCREDRERNRERGSDVLRIPASRTRKCHVESWLLDSPVEVLFETRKIDWFIAVIVVK
jgi:hypothetical protein